MIILLALKVNSTLRVVLCSATYSHFRTSLLGRIAEGVGFSGQLKRQLLTV